MRVSDLPRLSLSGIVSGVQEIGRSVRLPFLPQRWETRADITHRYHETDVAGACCLQSRVDKRIQRIESLPVLVELRGSARRAHQGIPETPPRGNVDPCYRYGGVVPGQVRFPEQGHGGSFPQRGNGGGRRERKKKLPVRSKANRSRAVPGVIAKVVTHAATFSLSQYESSS